MAVRPPAYALVMRTVKRYPYVIGEVIKGEHYGDQIMTPGEMVQEHTRRMRSSGLERDIQQKKYHETDARRRFQEKKEVVRRVEKQRISDLLRLFAHKRQMQGKDI
eukprot:TRINITY_DN531_c0_g1_i1.p1 TRINITY_DN531_c0_g1~~TRINITY_DN531_c0_g1_i1.p1  ORF type:complete len:116 (+),score=5.58 TRINITY_DN531_c0_g1_i1:31-348(+)